MALVDHHLIDLLSHFDRERIPERVVHAKGAGAHGTFTCTKSLEDVCFAPVFAREGYTCPLTVRFSTVGGESGSPDTARDPRGFSVKRTLPAVFAKVLLTLSSQSRRTRVTWIGCLTTLPFFSSVTLPNSLISSTPRSAILRPTSITRQTQLCFGIICRTILYIHPCSPSDLTRPLTLVSFQRNLFTKS